MEKQLEDKIKKELHDWPCVMEWDDYPDQDTVKRLLDKGHEAFYDELYEYNLDYLWEVEGHYIDNLFTQFDDELKAAFSEKDDDEIKEHLKEHFGIYCDININQLYRRMPDITCLINVYSNYDCANSFDKFEDQGYLYHVYKAVKTGVKKDDMLDEHANGCYGGSFFVFAFKCSVQDYFGLLEELDKDTGVKIPKGTQFGFHSSFQGASSMFEKTTHRNMTLKKQYGETEHDSIGLVADMVQGGYTMEQVYGDTGFIQEQNIQVY